MQIKPKAQQAKLATTAKTKANQALKKTSTDKAQTAKEASVSEKLKKNIANGKMEVKTVIINCDEDGNMISETKIDDGLKKTIYTYGRSRMLVNDEDNRRRYEYDWKNGKYKEYDFWSYYEKDPIETDL